MRRVWITCLVPIALLFTGSMALVDRATRDDPSAAAAGPARAEPAATPDAAGPDVATPDLAMTGPTAVPVPAPAAEDPDDLGVAPLPPPVSRARGARAVAAAHRTPAAPTPARREALADFRRHFKAGVAVLQERVAGCSPAGATFDLSLESVEGGVRVVDAAVASRGEATDAEVSCARSALQGQVIPAEDVLPGKQWRVPFAVPSS